jgi:uncharacterized protein
VQAPARLFGTVVERTFYRQPLAALCHEKCSEAISTSMLLAQRYGIGATGLDAHSVAVEDGRMTRRQTRQGTARESTRLRVRLTPRALREEIAGERDGILLVRVTAPPVDGAANEALVRLLAKALDVPRGSVRIASGATARMKVLEVTGIDEATARLRLHLDGVRHD